MIITVSNQATIHLTTVILIAIDAKCRQYKIRQGNWNDTQSDVFAGAKLLVCAIIRIPFSNVYSLERLNSVVFLRINRLVFDRIYLENGNWKELAVANLSQYCTHYITLLYLA